MSLKARQKKVPTDSGSERSSKGSLILPWDAVFVVLWPNREERMSVQDLVLNKLSKEQIQEALVCLYQDSEPSDWMLKSLNSEEWLFLAAMLDGLMNERKMYSLH